MREHGPAPNWRPQPFGFGPSSLTNDDGLALFSAPSPTPGGERPYPAIMPSVLLYGR